MDREDLMNQVTDHFRQSFGVNLISWDSDLAPKMVDYLYQMISLFGDDFIEAIHRMNENYKSLSTLVDED